MTARRNDERTTAGAHRMMRRADLEVSDPAQVAAIVASCKIIRIAYMDAEGLTIVPMNFGYVSEGIGNATRPTFYFHSAPIGRKIDAIKAAGNKLSVAFEMETDCEVVAGRVPCNWGEAFKSVVGYHLTFVSSLVLNVFTLVVVMLVNNGGHPARKTVMPSRNNAGWRNIVRHLRFSNLVEPRAIPLTMVFMMFAIPYFANQSFIVDYIAARHLAVSSDLFFVFYAAALLTMRITMKDLFDSKGFKFWLTICSIAMLAMLIFLAFMTNDWYLFGAGVAMAASYGLMSSVTQAQAVVIAGRERSGLANSTYYMGLDLGMALGPILAGIFYGHMPISWFYPAFMLTMPLAWIIYLVFARIIHSTARTDA